jgi:hypothetical protein
MHISHAALRKTLRMIKAFSPPNCLKVHNLPSISFLYCDTRALFIRAFTRLPDGESSPYTHAWMTVRDGQIRQISRYAQYHQP